MTAPLVDLRVVDPDMKDVPNDGKTAGEIVLRSPWLTQGYFDNPEGSEELWAGGYLHTSDIAVLTPDGYVQITDRIKDVIKTGGEWVSSLQIEDLITQCPGVAEAAVIGVKDERWGERPMALVVKDANERQGLTTPDIKTHLKVFADKRRHFEIWHPGENPFRRKPRQNQRRQDQQEGAAREIRRL